MVDFVKPFVETNKGVNYERFEAISYRSQVCSRVESKLIERKCNVPQVVAGTNYFVKVVATQGGDESALLLRIFKVHTASKDCLHVRSRSLIPRPAAPSVPRGRSPTRRNQGRGQGLGD